MDNNHNRELREESLIGLRDAVDAETVSVAEKMGRINSVYVRTARDKQLAAELRALVTNALAELTGSAEKRRILFVIGESGSGKSTAIKKHIADNPAFRPRTTADGEIIYPLITIEAPKPTTIKLLAKIGLEALGYPVSDGMQENAIWALFKRQLRERRVLFLHIDEMQHIMRGSTKKAIQDAADLIKGLTQIEGWPLHLILSGVPQLAQFLDRSNTVEKQNQLGNRKAILTFEAMTYPDYVPHLRAIIQRIVEVHAELKPVGITSDEFIERMIHATDGAFGTMIQFVRATIETVLYEGASEVTVEDFIVTYSRFSGCTPSQNIFLAQDFREIHPGNALAWLNEVENDFSVTRRTRGRRK